MISRRAAVSGMAGMTCAVLSSVPVSAKDSAWNPPSGGSLDVLARAKGLRFGTETSGPELNDTSNRAILLAECGVITPGNALKWPETEPRPGSFDFAEGDVIARFAADHGLLMRGHTLLWLRPQFQPQWLGKICSEPQPRARLERIITQHVATECGHYRQIRSWDVVSEAIDPSTGTYRQSDLMAAMGPQIVDRMFRETRQYAPHAQLVYNDYMSWNPSFKDHRAGVLRMLADLRKRNAPIDAVGLQSHLGPRPGDPGLTAEQEKDWRRFLDEVVAMGFGLLITELDILDNNFAGSPDARERSATDYMRAYLDVTLSYSEVRQVLTWGMVDHWSWRRHVHPPRDGKPGHSLPYDDDYEPTPIRGVIASALRTAPARG